MLSWKAMSLRRREVTLHHHGWSAVGAMMHHWQKRRLVGKPQGGCLGSLPSSSICGSVASLALSSLLYSLYLTGQNKEVKRGRRISAGCTGNFRSLAGKQWVPLPPHLWPEPNHMTSLIAAESGWCRLAVYLEGKGMHNKISVPYQGCNCVMCLGERTQWQHGVPREIMSRHLYRVLMEEFRALPWVPQDALGPRTVRGCLMDRSPR